jgi:hypothetical protein
VQVQLYEVCVPGASVCVPDAGICVPGAGLCVSGAFVCAPDSYVLYVARVQYVCLVQVYMPDAVVQYMR